VFKYGIGDTAILVEESANELMNKGMAEEENIQENTSDGLPPLILSNYLRNVRLFYEIHPFFYNKSDMFWFWNKEKNQYELWEIKDNILLDKLRLKRKYFLEQQKIDGDKPMKKAPMEIS